VVIKLAKSSQHNSIVQHDQRSSFSFRCCLHSCACYFFADERGDSSSSLFDIDILYNVPSHNQQRQYGRHVHSHKSKSFQAGFLFISLKKKEIANRIASDTGFSWMTLGGVRKLKTRTIRFRFSQS